MMFWARIPLQQLRFGTLAILFTRCLSEEPLKAVGPFYLVPTTDARGSKRSYPSALEMCNLPWTPYSILEKDNSQTLNHSLTQAVLAQRWAVWSIHKLVLNLGSKNSKIHAVQSSEDDMIEHTF